MAGFVAGTNADICYRALDLHLSPHSSGLPSPAVDESNDDQSECERAMSMSEDDGEEEEDERQLELRSRPHAFRDEAATKPRPVPLAHSFHSFAWGVVSANERDGDELTCEPKTKTRDAYFLKVWSISRL